MVLTFALDQAAEGSKCQNRNTSERFQNFIILVILVNAVTLGLETSKFAMANYGGLLTAIDAICLAIFISEIAAKLIVYRWSFFKSAWNVFDFTIVAIALIPAGEGLSVVRALRILRVLRLISMVPQMRIVVQALLSSVPAMGSVMALLALIYYVAAVMATKLFGADFPEWFGTIGSSLYTLFQVMTLESWSMGIARPVMEKHPYAWAFFVPFILVMTFMVLNLFIAIVVNSMAEVEKHGGEAPSPDPVTNHSDERDAAILAELKALRAEVAALRSDRSGPPRQVA
ncbi:MAG: ion transporter [Hyphomicrobiaceae bacterium]|nr:ion transporter [Hyphomicrobiaceae bacterium]